MLRRGEGIRVLGIVAAALALGGCDALGAAQGEGLEASGVVEAAEVAVAAEVGGRVAEVYVVEGDRVEAGEAVLRLEDDSLVYQREQLSAAHRAALIGLEVARAGEAAAQAALEAARAGMLAAHAHLEAEQAITRLEAQPERELAWAASQPGAFDLPPWYFGAAERIDAGQASVDAAARDLRAAVQRLGRVIDELGGEELALAEQRLSEAQALYLVADALRDRRIASTSQAAVRDVIDDLYEAADEALDQAQEDLDDLLSDEGLEDLVEARAQVAVARERHQTALDLLAALRTGEDSLRVVAAQALLRQAEAAVSQAEAGLAAAQAQARQAQEAVAQAEAGLVLVDLQIDRLTLRAAASGVVVVRGVEPGELLQPGATAVVLAQLDHLTVTVYVAEDRYGEIALGAPALVSADSFPERTFDARVLRIADQAEYTPRNVQTEEERRSTVFAVELAVDDPSGDLKPGMPVDVRFEAPVEE